MKTVNRIFLTLLILILIFEVFYLILGQLSLKSGNWVILTALIWILLLPERISKYQILIVSLYGISSILYYGNWVASCTMMEFTSGVSQVIFKSDTKSVFKTFIEAIPAYFYIVAIVSTVILFIRSAKLGLSCKQASRSRH